MARRYGKKGEKADKFPRQLVLAEQWAKQMGKKVDRVEVTLPNGNKIPILAIMHGNRAVLISTQHEVIFIFITIEIPKDIRKRLDNLDIAKQEKILLSLEHQLLSNARTAYRLEPQIVKKVSDLNKIIVEESIRISNKDKSSFNRFADAIQEVITVAVRAMFVFGIIPPEMSSVDPTKIKPPEGMYA